MGTKRGWKSPSSPGLVAIGLVLVSEVGTALTGAERLVWAFNGPFGFCLRDFEAQAQVLAVFNGLTAGVCLLEG